MDEKYKGKAMSHQSTKVALIHDVYYLKTSCNYKTELYRWEKSYSNNGHYDWIPYTDKDKDHILFLFDTPEAITTPPCGLTAKHAHIDGVMYSRTLKLCSTPFLPPHGVFSSVGLVRVVYMYNNWYMASGLHTNPTLMIYRPHASKPHWSKYKSNRKIMAIALALLTSSTTAA